MSHTDIIVELGSIAMGDLRLIRLQVQLSAEAGADTVKPQWLSNPDALVARRKAKGYAGCYGWLAYPVAHLDVLREDAQRCGLKMAVSCYLPGDVAVAAEHADAIKIASFEAIDLDMRDALGNTPALVSLGMCDDAETKALCAWRKARKAPTTLLHCVSDYTGRMPTDALHLSTIRRYGLDGFSDHTARLETGAYAVMAGARVLEVHLRLENTPIGHPDYACALSPKMLKAYIKAVRVAEQALGESVKAAQACEAECAKYRVKQP